MAVEPILDYREASRADCAYVYRLYMDAEANAFLVYDLMPENEFEILFEKLLRTGSFIIVEWNGRPVASYHLYEKEYRQRDTVYLATLVVDPLYKRKGIARAVLHQIISRSRAAHKNRIELEVSVNNHSAIAFYTQMGFEIEGTTRQSYKLGTEKIYYDDYRMAILL